ncbi:squalene/phytoene synthase family protein [Streptomyces sp. NPDC001719]
MSALLTEALSTVRRHSVTYYEPVMAMPPGLHETMASVYLLMRGIDEIEDHTDLSTSVKDRLLTDVSCALQTRNTREQLRGVFAEHRACLPEVTLRLADWCQLAPPSIAARVIDGCAALAERLAVWARRDWRIRTVDDLDHYIFSASATLGTLLCDLWAWHDGTRADRSLMMGYARGVQGANILADQRADRDRGVSFLPQGWGVAELATYVRTELRVADQFFAALPSPGVGRDWCSRPLGNAWTALGKAEAAVQTLQGGQQ